MKNNFKVIFTIFFSLTISLSQNIQASSFQYQGFEAFNFSANNFQSKLQNMIFQTQEILNSKKVFEELQNNQINLIPALAFEDSISSTLKYKQEYKNIEVLGEETFFHYNLDGKLENINGEILNLNLDVNPKISYDDFIKLLNDRYNTEIQFSESPKLKIFKDNNDNFRLVYHAKTKTQVHNNHIDEGMEVIVDAHTGEFLVESERKCTLLQRFVYTANTERALKNVDPESGAPMDININDYDLVFNNAIPKTKEERAKVDQSALRAYLNSGKVYTYYKKNFNRLSYDGKDIPIASVVHMGKNFNNAFWTEEYQIMAYGDGDGKILKDLTLGLDVAGHEITHAVTSHTANLMYQGESGALNESFSDFFGKMIEIETGTVGPAVAKRAPNWYIGYDVVGSELLAKGYKGIRNMANPEELKQPASMNSKYYVSTKEPCNRLNDNCGVHKNSGVPNYVSFMIVNALGQKNAQQIYYNVLTQRLKSNAKFQDAKAATIAACEAFFRTNSSESCSRVRQIFNQVGIQDINMKNNQLSFYAQ